MNYYIINKGNRLENIRINISYPNSFFYLLAFCDIIYKL